MICTLAKRYNYNDPRALSSISQGYFLERQHYESPIHGDAVLAGLFQRNKPGEKDPGVKDSSLPTNQCGPLRDFRLPYFLIVN